VAATLDLSLIQSAERNELKLAQTDARRIFLITGGAITLTLIINATLAGRVIQKLRLVEVDTEAVQMMQQYARNRIHHHVRDLIVELQDAMPLYNDGLVAEFCKIVAVNSVLRQSASVGGNMEAIGSMSSSVSETGQRVRSVLSNNQREGSCSINSPTIRRRKSVNMSEERRRAASLLDSAMPFSEGGLEMLEMMFTEGRDMEDESEGLEEERMKVMCDDSIQDVVRENDTHENIRMNELNNHLVSDQTPSSVPAVSSTPLFSGPLATAPDIRLSPPIDTATQHSLLPGIDSLSVSDIQTTKEVCVEQGTEKEDELYSLSRVNRISSANLIALQAQYESKSHGVNLPPGAKAAMAGQKLPAKPIRREAPVFKPVDSALLCHIRSVFLNLVKGVYWNNIKLGKLPRNSNSALALLFSIDVAHDHVHSNTFEDWQTLQTTLNKTSFDKLLYVTKLIDCIRLGSLSMWQICRKQSLDAILDNSNQFITFTSVLEGILETMRHETAVYVLSSFIEAHEHAQQKIMFYMGEKKRTDMTELIKVVQDSKEHVELAKEMLSSIDRDEVSYIVTKQVSRLLLTAQQVMVEELEEEGVLRPVDATVLHIETRRVHRQLERKWLLNTAINQENISRIGHRSI